MKCNVGGVDQTARVAGGLIALGVGLGLFGRVSRGWRMALLGMGGAAISSGLTRYCPVNEALGVDTCTRSISEAAEEAVESMQQLAE